METMQIQTAHKYAHQITMLENFLAEQEAQMQ